MTDPIEYNEVRLPKRPIFRKLLERLIHLLTIGRGEECATCVETNDTLILFTTVNSEELAHTAIRAVSGWRVNHKLGRDTAFEFLDACGVDKNSREVF